MGAWYRASMSVIHGMAYGRAATLEVDGDTLRWRAHRGFAPIAENVVTTVHDVREVQLLVQRVSWAGLVTLALGALWVVRHGVATGGAVLAVAAGLLGYRLARPRRLLVLELGGTRLVLQVDRASAAGASTLVTRIDRVLASGEVSSSPPMLP